ncbi:MAG: type II secretion system protein GspG [Leptospiraceae bacterium]|nr:type II secretion system protein GspG [Leptospiraceae bacterium]
MKKRNRIRRGLTLVELAVVVLILGAIITLVALNIRPGDLKDDTAALKLRKDANELQMHLERYSESFGKYPSEEQGLMALVEKPTTGEVPENYKPMLKNKQAILDPWGSTYQLKTNNNGDVMIVSLGKDKREGGEGKNKDFNILNEEDYPTEFTKGGKKN